MLTFLKESLAEQYATEPKSGMKVLFRYNSGKKEQRIFPEGSLIENLYDYVWSKRQANTKFYLLNFNNKERLVDVSIPLFALEDEDGDITVIVNDQ